MFDEAILAALDPPEPMKKTWYTAIKRTVISLVQNVMGALFGS